MIVELIKIQLSGIYFVNSPSPSQTIEKLQKSMKKNIKIGVFIGVFARLAKSYFLRIPTPRHKFLSVSSLLNELRCDPFCENTLIKSLTKKEKKIHSNFHSNFVRKQLTGIGTSVCVFAYLMEWCVCTNFRHVGIQMKCVCTKYVCPGKIVLRKLCYFYQTEFRRILFRPLLEFCR